MTTRFSCRSLKTGSPPEVLLEIDNAELTVASRIHKASAGGTGTSKSEHFGPMLIPKKSDTRCTRWRIQRRQEPGAQIYFIEYH